MPMVPGNIPVECADCGVHLQVDPAGNIQGAACPECGGNRFFRTQPSPTQSDGTLRNMVDSDSQKDQGGNPLGEGTIVGTDGERPAGKRDNYMHSKVADTSYMELNNQLVLLRQGLPTNIQRKVDEVLREQGMNAALHYVKQVTRPQAEQNDASPFWDALGISGFGNPLFGAHSHAEKVEPMNTLNMEPYPPLWDESYIPKLPQRSAGFIAPLIEGAGALLGGEGLSSAVPTLMKGALLGGGMQMGKNFIGGPEQQGGGQQPSMPEPMQALGSNLSMLLVSDLDTPHSVKSVGEQHDDPEKQDQKEFNDGDKNPSNLKNPNNDDSGASGEDGVRDATPGYGFGPNSPGVQRAQMILPLLLHYFMSDESGESDPLIRGLHDALEQENPGYLNQEHPDGPKIVEMLIQHHKQPHGVHAGVNAFPSGLPAMPGVAMDSPQQQGAQGTCRTCGAPLAADGSCPNCGAQDQGHPQGQPGAMGGGYGQGDTSTPPNAFTGKVGTSGAGPQTDEQKDSVRRLLELQGRLSEVPLVDTEPWRFHQELAEIQQNPNIAPLVDPSQAQPAPQQPMMNPSGAMPMPDPSQMGGGGQPMQPLSHLAADSVAPRCPNCGSGTTGVRQSTGDDGMSFECNACHHVWDDQADKLDMNKYKGAGFQKEAPGKEHMKGVSPKRNRQYEHIKEQLLDSGDNEDHAKEEAARTVNKQRAEHGETKKKKKSDHLALVDVPNPALQNTGEMTWHDSEGQPIQVGQTYELHTPGIPAPDHVEVMSKSADKLDLKLIGEIAGIHANQNTPDITITPHQMLTSKYTFVPSNDAVQETPEQPLGGMPGLEQIPQSGPTTDEVSNSYPNEGTSLAHVAAEEEPEDLEDICSTCGGNWIDHIASSPETTMHECARCGSVWETRDDYEGREASADLKWVLGSNSPDDDFHEQMERAKAMRDYGGQSRSLASALAKDDRYQKVHDLLEHNKQARTAGRHFTPGEQRALINERGTARNADLLDLTNTHYETLMGYDPRDPKGRANGLNAPDEHLVLGL